GDSEQGLLKDAGQKLPLIDKVVFTLEKENTSYWNKFLQGYYDISGISSDSFEQAIQLGNGGEFGLSDAMVEKGIDLQTTVGTSSYYIGFNMQDSVVGGYSEQAKKLRQAISIAINYEEYISIFLNGRGIAAQGSIPPGIFGYLNDEQGINNYVYDWDNNKAKRKDISEARALLIQAGYPNGRSEKTGEPLNLYFDVPASGPDAKAQFDWLRKQFQKLGIQLVIRSSDYNRFQDKMHNGQAQIFQWGWNADYPDPENFLFLLYGPNGKVATGGENAANYQNVEFDHLFEQMRVMPNNKERQNIINKMSAILTEDSPWIWGYHPKQFSLYHRWNKNIKPNMMANNTIKYRRIDAQQRKELQQSWNKPILWPLAVLLMLGLLILLPAWLLYMRKKQSKVT
ncbi:MAG: peptide ABC transporter substrate-binding protein, partial [Proteobacteria bacterium]|nr:peptide ABC transporter substrate-binding protein [Pseudomonadota bacterium]